MQSSRRENPFLKFVDAVGSWTEKASGLVSALLLIFMTAVAILGVVFRYIMSQPFEWTEEISRFFMLLVIFLSINTAFRKNEHIAITSFVDHFPERIVSFLDYLTHALIAFFLVVLMVKGYGMTTRTLMTASTFNFSMTWIYMFVPLGAFLTLVQLVVKVILKISSDLGYDRPGLTQTSGTS